MVQFAARRRSGRAALDRIAEGGCPHLSILGSSATPGGRGWWSSVNRGANSKIEMIAQVTDFW
jgi:hypothetical protein